MKALDWQRFLELQRKQHGKALFRVAELANVAGRDSHALNVELGRLVKKGVFTRYAAGIYGLSDGMNPEQLVSMLDDGAYITGMYALYHHDLITQAPTEITCFTNRRHNRSRQRATPFGSIILACVSPKIYRKPANGVFAPPEQALCDFAYLAGRSGLDPASLVTFRNLNRISRRQLSTALKRYPRSVAQRLKQTLSDSGA
jgi:hypothetical protein